MNWRPVLSPRYVACARDHALDLAASLILFVGASIAAGRIWRFAFDDELLTFNVAERSRSALDFAAIFLKGGDIHPPLAFLGFYGLLQLGLPDWGMRLCSLALTGLALALFHILCLMLVAQRTGAPACPFARLVAILLFGLCPLAVSQGDAIRWYPLFVTWIALFVTLYIAGANPATRLWSAVPLGLAASTNFLAIVVALPLLLYRHVLQRQFRLGYDAAYWLIVAVLASPGLWTAYWVVFRHLDYITDSIFGFGLARAVALDALGFFGGDAIGVGYAWIVVPAIVIAVFAVFSAVDRKTPADPSHLLLLMLCAIPTMELAGFAEPRAYLYLAPVMATILTLFISRQEIDRGAGRALLLASCVLVAAIGAVANINQSMRPFKRNAAVPFQQIIAFIESNSTGNVMVLSTDPIVARALQHDRARPDRCVSYVRQNRACFDPARGYDTVFVVSAHTSMALRPAFNKRFENVVKDLTAGKRKIVTVPVGLDKDAELKAWLTGVAIGPYILTVDLYR